MRRRATLERLWERYRLPILGGALFLLSALVTLLLLLARGGPPAAQAPQPAAAAPAETEPLLLSELILPDRQSPQEVESFRTPLKRWGDEQVRRFWVPLESVVKDILIKENDRRIRKLFEGIP